MASSLLRFQSLDALRGFAILTMVLSGVIPYGTLPDWTYHAQLPPPAHKFDPTLPGITWVDLVFPFFLFAMGAAFPLALQRRLERGESVGGLVRYILGRGGLLVFFAIYLQHIRPFRIMAKPDAVTWLLALLGFLLLFPIFLRLPQAWPGRWRWSLKLAGWGGALLLLALLRYPDGSGFSLYRSDIIIIVLANMAVFGALLWLFTRGNLLLRFGILALLLGFRLAAGAEGNHWVDWIWHYSPAPWVYKMDYLKYLFIVIPGTAVGDLLLRWQQAPLQDPAEDAPARSFRPALAALLLLLLIIFCLYSLKSRWEAGIPLVAALLCAGAWRLLAPEGDPLRQRLRTLLGWGVYWLFLGLILEPFEGGIKKDPSTLSYYFVTGGLAIALLIVFMIIREHYRKSIWLRLLSDNGQNPMIAYAGMANFILPLFHLSGLQVIFDALSPTPWLGFLRGVFYTFLLTLFVSFFTRKKLFWRT